MNGISFFVFRFLLFLGFASAILLRFLFLDSDPYPELDWSSGLLTDESFYAHNARNLALFGQTRTDEFNNMLLAPLVHLVQSAVFKLFGAGFVPARMISAASSLLALALLFAALRRVFGLRVALTSALLLGLDHTGLLYSRMALLDSMAVLPAIGAFCCFVRGIGDEGRPRMAWLAGAGLLLAITISNRALCLFLLPAPLIALGASPERKRDIFHVFAGFAAALALYVVFWYVPNHIEIGRMTGYYRTHQLQPRSSTHLGQNLYHAALGDQRGLAPYLFRHTPVVFTFALLGLFLATKPKRDDPERPNARTPERLNPSTPERLVTSYLAAWLLLGWLVLSVISYSPSRYYVTTYPAMCALAGWAVWQAPRIVFKLAESRLLRALLVWFIAYHAVQTIVHRDGSTMVLLYGVPSLLALTAGLLSVKSVPDRPAGGWLVYAAVLAWTAVNLGWMGHWLSTLRWSQAEMGAWLNRALPANSVVLGDVAAGLGLGHRFVAINVIPGLCNDGRPVEGFAGRSRYIVILDGRWKERYWRERYPALVEDAKRIHLSRVIRWDVGVYQVRSSAE